VPPQAEVGAKLFQGRHYDRLVRINTNVSSLQALRAVSEHTKQIENSTGKISSGTRVRSAADDAASLSLGLKSQTTIRSQHQALRNANDVISEFQVAEGGMNEISAMLTRLRELSIQASSDTLQDEDRGMLNEEYMALRHEIERQSKTTRYRGDTLLRPSGNSDKREFQIGTASDANSRLVVNQEDLTLSEFNMGIVDSNVETGEEARINLKYIDQAIEKVALNRARVGAMSNRVQSTINNLDVSRVNESAANSQRMDTDYAFETAEKIRGEQKLQAATSVLSQANNLGAAALKLIKDS
jgi:flagellin